MATLLQDGAGTPAAPYPPAPSFVEAPLVAPASEGTSSRSPVTPIPWVQRRLVALPTLTVAVLAIAAIWAGLALAGVVLAFSASLTLLAELALGLVAAELMAAGIGWVATTKPA